MSCSPAGRSPPKPGESCRRSSDPADYPPEALAGRPVDGKADIHQLHTLMLDLLAPGEHAQIAYARGCLQENPRMRPSADALLDEYDDLIGRLYGRRRFRPFALPATAA